MRDGAETFAKNVAIFAVMLILAGVGVAMTKWLNDRDRMREAFDDVCEDRGVSALVIVEVLAAGGGIGYFLGIAERRRLRGAILGS